MTEWTPESIVLALRELGYVLRPFKDDQVLLFSRPDTRQMAEDLHNAWAKNVGAINDYLHQELVDNAATYVCATCGLPCEWVDPEGLIRHLDCPGSE